MKKLSKSLTIINIISLILIFIQQFNLENNRIYDNYIEIFFKVVTIFIGISAFISAIIEFKNRNKQIGFINIVIMMLIVPVSFLNYIYMDAISLYFKIVTILVIISAIISAIKAFKNNNKLILIVNIIFILLALVCSFLKYDNSSILVLPLIISIFNLILIFIEGENKLNLITIFIIIISAIIETIFAFLPTIYVYRDLKNLENALPKLHEQKNLTTYVYKKDNKYIYLDSQGNKIAEKDFDEIVNITLDNHYIYNIEIGEEKAYLGIAKKGNKAIIINSEGEELFEIYNLFSDYYSTAEKFMAYVINNNKFGIRRLESSSYGNEIESKMFLKKDKQSYNSFESTGYEYMYFKNSEITNKILQIVIKPNEKEDDRKLSTEYLDVDFNNKLHRDVNKIKEFYENKKEYYLLDIENNTKTKLECNNLIYEAYYDEKNKLYENILLYSNGFIPFYDTKETGYFDLNGEKLIINPSYLIIDINNNFYVLMEKETGTTVFLSMQTGNIEKTINDITRIFNSFYVINSYSNGEITYKILDKNLNEIVTTDNLSFVGNNFIRIHNNYKNEIYYYDNENIKLLETIDDDRDPFRYKFIPK